MTDSYKCQTPLMENAMIPSGLKLLGAGGSSKDKIIVLQGCKAR